VEPIRAFFAVELADATRAAAADVVRRLRGRAGAERVRFVRAENLHVTLCFLGEVDPALAHDAAARARTETTALAPFALALGALRAFPSPRRPRVVALELEPEAPLAALAAAVARGAAGAGLALEERAFRAHLTLGRIGDGRFPEAGGIDAAPAPMTVREAVLFQSRLGRDGSRYTPLERIALGGNQSPQTQT
jgi:2'-5' RNA ligase